MTRTRLFLAAFAGTLLLSTALAAPLAAQDEAVRCAGCKTEHFLIQHVAGPFTAATGVNLLPGGAGNKMAVTLFAEGKIDFAYTCKPHQKLAKKFGLDPAVTGTWVSTAIARDPIAVVANPDCGVTGLTVEQLSGIFTGRISNWSEVGGPDLRIVVAYMDEAVESGIVTVFKETTAGEDVPLHKMAKTLKAPDQLGTFVQTTSGGVTFLAMNSYLPEYGALLAVDGVAATHETVIAGSYPLSVTYHILHDSARPSAGKALLGFLATPEGTALIDEMMVALPQKDIVVQ